MRRREGGRWEKKRRKIFEVCSNFYSQNTHRKLFFFSLQQKVKASKTFINAVIQAARDGVFSP